MYSPTTRVLTLLDLLQTLGRVSGAELARRLEVDPRTLRRYIGKLEDIGIPVTTERGRYGGYALMPGFKLPPMVFTDDEALGLCIGLLAAGQLGLTADMPAIESAQAKLHRVMPERLKQRIHALRETVQLDLARAAPSGGNQVLMSIGEAAHGRLRADIRYRSASGESTQRSLDTYGLAWRGGHWYAVGHCHLRGELRSFRLDRIGEVVRLSTRFEPPVEFDAVAHLTRSLATLPRAFRVQLLLKTDLADARRQLFDTIGLFQPCDRGVLLHSQTDDLAWSARQLAGLECDFEIIDPPALRTELALHAQRLLANAARMGSQDI